MTAYQRVLLKLSGEVFGGGEIGVDPKVVNGIAREIADVVRTNVYLADMADYAAMNAAYVELFPHRPARTCVAVAALPLGARVEIDCIAVRSAG